MESSITRRSAWKLFRLREFAPLCVLLCMGTFARGESDSANWAKEMWDDPEFKKNFVATYGINSEIEPKLAPEDIEILAQVRPLMADNLDQAESLLKTAVNPERSATLDFTLAGIYFQQDKRDEALTYYNAAVEKFPNFRRAWRNIGLIHARENRHQEAIKAFTKLITLGGGDAYAYGTLGYCYSGLQDNQPAEAAYRLAMILQPENTDWRLGLIRAVFKQQKFEEAAALLEPLITAHPEKADFWMLQAQAYLGMKQPLKAAQDLEAVNRIGKGTADGLHTLGDIYFNENLMDPAAAAYVRSIQADSGQPERALKAAERLASRGALDQAKRVASRVRESGEKDMDGAARRRLLKVEARIAMAEGGGKEAVKALLEIIKIEPLDGEALMMLGRHFADNQEPDRAIFYYERAAGIEGFEATASIRQAQTLAGLGRYSEAVPLLRRAQEVKPREDVSRYLEQIERIAKTR